MGMHRSPPLPGDSSLLDNTTLQLTCRPTEMPQFVPSESFFCESSSSEDDFAIRSDSDNSYSWSPKLKKNEQQPGKMAINDKAARKITFCRLPTSSFQTSPTPHFSMLTRGLKRFTVNNSQAGMRSAANYKKREWDPQGWSELSHCQQYERHLKCNMHMIGPAEEAASKRFEHGGDEENRRYGW